MNRKKVRLILLSFSFVLMSVLAHAKKPPTPPQQGALEPFPPPPGLPIDGGLSFLLISGVAYGIYSLKRKK